MSNAGDSYTFSMLHICFYNVLGAVTYIRLNFVCEETCTRLNLHYAYTDSHINNRSMLRLNQMIHLHDHMHEPLMLFAF
jgi:hypothetical protein